ncbi:hypothetical protein L7F22_022701 [Adiantum nelumboides]|nr:hypothetical protein [Adiantum nelumboides]
MDCTTAWRILREPRPTTPIEDPQIWHDYAERLYQVPAQLLIPEPPDPRPTTSTFFTSSMVERAIRRLQHGRSADHTGLQSEHLIYAADTLSPLLARLFNRALVEGLRDEWTMHTIVPIHKSGDTLDPGNYRTIMIGHTLAKLYGAVLEAELSTHAEAAGIRAPGQADLVSIDLHTLQPVGFFSGLLQSGGGVLHVFRISLGDGPILPRSLVWLIGGLPGTMLLPDGSYFIRLTSHHDVHNVLVVVSIGLNTQFFRFAYSVKMGKQSKGNKKEIMRIERESVIMTMKPRLVMGLADLLELDSDREEFFTLCKRIDSTIRAWYHQEFEEIMQLYSLFDPVHGAKKLEQQSLSPARVDSLEQQFVYHLVKILEKSNYKLLSEEEVEIATSGQYLLNLPIVVDSSKLDSKLFSKYFADNPRDGLPTFANKYALFRQGIGIDRTTDYFIMEKIDSLISRLWDILVLKLRLRRLLFFKQLNRSSSSISRIVDSIPDAPDAAEQDLYVERVRIENLNLSFKDFLSKTTVQEPTFERMILIYRQATPPKSPLKYGDRAIHIKRFRNIPMADMELVLPEKKNPGLTPMDWTKLLISAGLGLTAPASIRGLLMPVSDEPELIDQNDADDTLLFLHYTPNALDMIRYALDEVFCVASGACINWDKAYGILAGSDDIPTWGPTDFTWLRQGETCRCLGFRHLSMAGRALVANQVLLASAWYVASCWTLHGGVMRQLRRLIKIKY